MCEIAETVGISTGSAVSILHDHLHMKKLNVKWVPHFLHIEQKEKRVADSKSCLDVYNRNPNKFFDTSLWMRLGSITTLRSPIGHQLSGKRPMKAVRSV